MKIALWMCGLILLLAGCTSEHPSPPSQQEAVEQPSPQPTVRSSDFPGFGVDLTFSDKTKKELIERKETVIVTGSMTGVPREGAVKQYVNEMGEIDLGALKAEVAPGENVTFGKIRLKQEAFEQTDKRDPELLINVYSGRKSSKDNLLDCGIYQGSLQAVQRHSIPISCKLIGEN